MRRVHVALGIASCVLVPISSVFFGGEVGYTMFAGMIESAPTGASKLTHRMLVLWPYAIALVKKISSSNERAIWIAASGTGSRTRW